MDFCINSMVNFIVVVLSVVITSFFYFPFEFVFSPGINTKMVLGGVGLVLLGFNLAKSRNSLVDVDFILVSIIAIIISIISLITMTYNGTPDNSFLWYFISMWVWMGGAYAVIQWLKWSHQYISVELVCNYLMLVCVCQCILALSMNLYSPLKESVDNFLGGNSFMGRVDGRLYGIGCALDVAGLRFSAVLVMIAYLCSHGARNLSTKRILMYLISFLIIVVLGNMISRTTIVGTVIALIYWIFFSEGIRVLTHKVNNRFWYSLIGVLIVSISIVVYYYHTNPTIHNNIRFAFEGFFSLAETGKWQTASNDILLNHMIVFPDNLETWIIGDGYAANPSFDPYYMGLQYHGFYKGTDIGYLRYIFYFGLSGLVAFMFLFIKIANICANKFPTYKLMFYFMLIINFIGWGKVTSDILPAFALFLCISVKDELALKKMVKNDY